MRNAKANRRKKEKSGRGLPHSKTLARHPTRLENPKVFECDSAQAAELRVLQ
jgi:hypothetical protein